MSPPQSTDQDHSPTSAHPSRSTYCPHPSAARLVGQESVPGSRRAQSAPSRRLRVLQRERVSDRLRASEDRPCALTMNESYSYPVVLLVGNIHGRRIDSKGCPMRKGLAPLSTTVECGPPSAFSLHLTSHLPEDRLPTSVRPSC